MIYDVARVLNDRPEEPTPLYEVVVDAIGADPAGTPRTDLVRFEVSFEDLTGSGARAAFRKKAHSNGHHPQVEAPRGGGRNRAAETTVVPSSAAVAEYAATYEKAHANGAGGQRFNADESGNNGNPERAFADRGHFTPNASTGDESRDDRDDRDDSAEQYDATTAMPRARLVSVAPDEVPLGEGAPTAGTPGQQPAPAPRAPHQTEAADWATASAGADGADFTPRPVKRRPRPRPA